MKNKKVVIGLSGGVDSAVSAYLLKKDGYEVEAVYMKNWKENEGNCKSDDELIDVKIICSKLDIVLHIVDFSEDYWKNVFLVFIKELSKGKTPNPDCMCNKQIKFDVFLKYANKINADYIATGHYAKIIKKNGIFRLHCPKDKLKDQTYFLCNLNQSNISKVIFPLNDIEKHEVRKIAKEIGLSIYSKKDSTGICFIGEKKFKPFIKKYITEGPGTNCGKIIDKNNNVVGYHDGVIFYTVGQRKGLGIGGKKEYKENLPWYVVEKNIKDNLLLVTNNKNDESLYSKNLFINSINWISGIEQDYPLKCLSKIRYRQNFQSCIINKHNDGFIIVFDKPQRAITIGQIISFYYKNECLGGAEIIEKDLIY